MNVLVETLMFGTTLSAKETRMLRMPDFGSPESEHVYSDSMILFAQKSGDVDLLVASLQRWGLSMVALDAQNVDTIVARIREFRQRDKRVDAKALLCLLEAQYDYSSDVYLEALSLGKKRLQKYRVEDYPNILEQGNVWGRSCLPTLYDLIKQQQYSLWPSYDVKNKICVWQDWTSEYAQALRLYHSHLNRSNRFLVDDFLSKHPNAPLAPLLRNKINRLERKCCMACPKDNNFSPYQPVQVQIKSRNVSKMTLVVREERTDSVVICQDFNFENFKPYVENDTIVNLSTLPLGRYCLQCIASDCCEVSDEKKNEFAVTNHFPMLVSWRPDLTSFFEEDKILAVDLWTGVPIDEAKVDTFGTLSAKSYGARFHTMEFSYHIRVLSDLSAYHPGDQVRWLCQVWKKSLKEQQVASSYEAMAYLINPVGDRIDSLPVKTDNWGVFRGAFQLPKDQDAYQGTYQVSVEKYYKCRDLSFLFRDKDETSFEVYEYDSSQSVLEAFPFDRDSWGHDTIELRYRLYSIGGSPLPNVPIRVNCGRLDTCVYTNTEGTMALPVTNQMLVGTSLKDSCLEYCKFYYAKATVEKPGNEKQSVGQCVYFYGNMQSPPPPPPPPLCDCWDDQNALFEMKEEDCTAQDGFAKFRFETKVADVHLYYLATSHKGEKQQGWLHYEQPGCQTLTFPLEDDCYNSFMSLCLAGVYHGKGSSQEAVAAYPKRVLGIEMDACVDTLAVGSRHHCRFQVLYEDETPATARVLMMVRQKSSVLLDEHTWSLKQNLAREDDLLGRITMGYSYSWSNCSLDDGYHQEQDSVQPKLPVLQMWGQNISPEVRHYYGLTPFPQGGSSSLPLLMLKRDFSMYYEGCFDPDERSTYYGAKMFHGPLFDKSVTSAALYETELVTKSDGSVDFDIDVPNEEGLWELKVIAFDQNMNLSEFSKQIVTIKK